MVASSSAGPTLASVRRDLEQIDRAIVVLVAARVEAACTAIRCRSRAEGRIANPAQEARVLARAKAWGKDFGLSPELTSTIFRAIIETGKSRFASEAGLSASTAASSPSEGRRPRALARHAPSHVPRAGMTAPA